MRINTLLSDFGLEDGYVAAMKGVIASIAPEARLVDVTHLVPPQDVAFARFRLLTVAPYFPAGTVHLAVVDPSVGTARRAVAIQSRSGSCFIGPDNGVLLGALETDPPMAAVELSEPRFWRTSTPTATFHGRDPFAPVAAHLARGVTQISGYLGVSWTAASSVTIDGQTFHGVSWESRSFDAPSYYGWRVGYFFSEGEWGLSLDFFHDRPTRAPGAWRRRWSG